MRTTIRNRTHSGYYAQHLGPVPSEDYGQCERCGSHDAQLPRPFEPDVINDATDTCDNCIAQLRADEDAEYRDQLTQATCWPVNEDGQPEHCGCNRPDCENPEPGTRHLRARPDYEYSHPEHVKALRDVQARIQAKTAELEALRSERLDVINAALADGMQKVRMCAPLGVSKQQVNKWTTEAKEARRMAGERELF